MVEKEYSSTVPSGDQTIDSVENEVSTTATWEGEQFTPPDIGRETKMSIDLPRLEKSVAYVNGIPPSGPIEVRTVDTNAGPMLIVHLYVDTLDHGCQHRERDG